jgi:hypothetical protein
MKINLLKIRTVSEPEGKNELSLDFRLTPLFLFINFLLAEYRHSWYWVIVTLALDIYINVSTRRKRNNES